MKKRELVITVPTQVKKNLNLGNLYEFILADFYTKIRRLKGEDVAMAVTWNANGKPIEDAVIKNKGKFNNAEATEMVGEMIADANKVMERFFVKADIQVRDDNFQEELQGLLDEEYMKSYTEGHISIVICRVCGDILGTDSDVTKCNQCGEDTEVRNYRTYFKQVRRENIESKMRNTKFYPEGCKKRLEELLKVLPQEYNIVLEKKRQYTLQHKGYKLDPRFVTIFSIPVIKQLLQKEFDTITVIQGDVVKKYDYYAFAYLNEKDCPTNVFMHGLIVDGEKRKCRWKMEGDKVFVHSDGVKEKEFRAYLLKHNLTENIMIDNKTLKGEVKGQVNLYIKMKRLMEERNLDVEAEDVRKELQVLYQDFLECASNLQMSKAYSYVLKYVNSCWKLTKENKLSKEEQEIVRNFMELYYGG